MRLSDAFRKCVGFLYIETKSGARPVGTCFFVGRAGKPGKVLSPFLVTARHVIEGAQKESTNGSLYVRLNSLAGKNILCNTQIANWLVDPSDGSIDVAVHPGAPNAPDADVGWIDRSLFLNATIRRENEIGVADDTRTVGLFVNHAGVDSMVPVVRCGNIAAMPGEPVQIGKYTRPAYLVEMRSIGGLSGSPVFVDCGAVRKINNQIVNYTFEKPQPHQTAGLVLLLGLVQGHWKVVPGPATQLEGEAVNMGLSIVVPSEDIARVLDWAESEVKKGRPPAIAIS